MTEGSADKTIDYLGGFQYEKGNMEFFPTAEGYVKATEIEADEYAFNYVYNYTDHLGNVRLRYTKDPEDENKVRILEEDHYYPFGMKHQGYNNEHEIIVPPVATMPLYPTIIIPITPDQEDSYRYKYNGKEFQEELGLNWYDYGARNYDAALGRWMNVDPLAEDYPEWSPYNYTMNNPLRFIDPDGRSVEDPPTKKGVKTGDTFYDRDNTELYTWNNNDGVWQGDKGNLIMNLDETVITASGKKSGISSFFDRLFSFFTPSKNARGLNLYYLGGNGNNGMYLPKGKGATPVDVDVFIDYGIMPGGAPSTSALVNQLQLDATFLSILSEGDPLGGVLNKQNNKDAQDNRSSQTYFVQEDVIFLIMTVGGNAPQLHRQETSILRAKYHSKTKADSSINVRKQDSLKYLQLLQIERQKYEKNK